MSSSELLFDTWDGEETNINTDLKAILRKHDFEEELADLLEDTLLAVLSSGSNSSHFTTEMWVAFKKYRKSLG